MVGANLKAASHTDPFSNPERLILVRIVLENLMTPKLFPCTIEMVYDNYEEINNTHS